MKNQKVTVTKNGPYLVSGNIPLSKTISIVGSQGEPEEWKKGKKYPEHEKYTLCRCGKSQNKPCMKFLITSTLVLRTVEEILGIK